jgi:hypothetical protein
MDSNWVSTVINVLSTLGFMEQDENLSRSKFRPNKETSTYAGVLSKNRQ